MSRFHAGVAAFALSLLLAFSLLLLGCGGDDFDLGDQEDKGLTEISVDRSYFKDGDGRYVTFHGVNVSGSDKVPASVDPISYVGKPFPIEDADRHFSDLRRYGLNAIRLVLIWEGIEPYQRGVYDEEYLDYIEQVVAKADEYGIYVLMDMHQDLFSRYMARLFNDGTGVNALYDPAEVERGAPWGFNNRVAGDGAPGWAVQACLPEKNVGGPEWGLPPVLASDANQTSDFIPFSLWGANLFTSVDVDRCFAALLAGRDVFPYYEIDGLNIQDWLQEAYAEAWAQVARRVAKYPNVIAYDIMNEPDGVFILMTVWALLYQKALATGDGEVSGDLIDSVLSEYLGSLVDLGMPADQAEYVRETLIDYDLVPDSLDRLRQAAFLDASPDNPYRADIGAVIALNANVNRNYLENFHSLVGARILEEDPTAIFAIEQVLGISDRSGIYGQYITPMRRPAGLDRIIYAPHWYTDIYPFLGINQPPRDFTVDEKRFRDYMDGITDAIEPAEFSLGDPPVLMGEFGSYFNFGGIEQSAEEGFIVSSHIIDLYYEVFEELLLSHTQWCWSAENTALNGEGWNKEDFSILGFDGEYRSATAWARPFARAASGRPIETHFYSDHHYYDPVPDEPTPIREFYLKMGAAEVKAPTEIAIPEIQYPDGFYVYISDGRCAFGPEHYVLYWYPEDDDPQATHDIRLRPPYADFGDGSWDYFFHGSTVRENPNRS